MSDKVLKADGLDAAIIGTDYRTGNLIYSVDLVLDILRNRDNMSYEDAYEFFAFNIASAYVGAGTPIFMDPGYDEDQL